MKRNISVFILLILLASSFKYRTKARETDQQLITAGYAAQDAPQKSEINASFDATVIKLHQANQEFVRGNPELLKSLWAHTEEVTVFDGAKNQELKGWKSIETALNANSKRSNVNYSSKKINSHEGDDQAYLLQEEYYEQPGGETVNLHVTVLFRKENHTWRIVHKHEDILAKGPQSDKTAK